MIKNWNKFNESLKDDLANKLTSNVEFKQAIIEMLEASVNSSDMNVFQEFIDSYLKDPDKTNIEGLINDSDVWDFYSKWTNDIDEILDKVKWFEEIPSENNSYGVYDYVIKSTKRAIKEAIVDIKEEALKSNESNMFNFFNIFKKDKKDNQNIDYSRRDQEDSNHPANDTMLGTIVLVESKHKDGEGRMLTHVYQIVSKNGVGEYSGIFIGNLRQGISRNDVIFRPTRFTTSKKEKIEDYRLCAEKEKSAINNKDFRNNQLETKTGFKPKF